MTKNTDRKKFSWRDMLTHEKLRSRIQFVCVTAILSVISLGMTVLNYITGWGLLMWSTLIFGVLNIINCFLIYRRGKSEKIAKVLFSVEFTTLFTFFVIAGEPEGFSAIWAALLPSCGLLLYKIKYGSIISMIQLAILAFLLWTPFGNSLLQYEYTTSFKMRFPILYVAFFLVGLFFEIVRNTTQEELVIARDKFKALYNIEGIRADAEEQKNSEILYILASEYDSVFYVNLRSGNMTTYTRNSDSSSGFDNFFGGDTGYEQAYNNFVHSMVFEDDRLMMMGMGKADIIRNELKNQKTFVTVFRVITEDGPRYYEMKCIRVSDKGDEPDEIALAFSDKDYQVRQDQEQQLALEQALADAERASAAKSTFLFNMSHDIRTPMNAIIGFTDMASKHIDEKEKVTECLDKVNRSSQHLLKLINDVLDMSRIENGKVQIEEAPVSVHDCAEDIMAMCRDLARSKNIELTLEDKGVKHDFIFADEIHVNQILMNLISNAIKYTEDGGRVNYTIGEIPSAVEGYGNYTFTVEDNGIGMSAEYLEHIFDAFSRERNSTHTKVQGTGLGMSIVKRLTELLDGKIEIESRPGEGTKIVVTLPFRIQQTQQMKKEKEEAGENVDISGKRILLVEDNEMNREIATEILEDEGLIVETAEDGDVAVDMATNAEAGYYDCILMDIQMPRMDGYTATAHIREKMTADNWIPIIALSANAFEEDKKKSLLAGMDDHLAKPIDVGALIKVLVKFLNK